MMENYNMDDRIIIENCTDGKLIKATVVSIEWERVTFFLNVKIEFSDEADKSEPLIFYAVNGAYSAKAVLRQESVNGGIYRLSLNVTNPGNARCVPTGNYSLVVCQKENALAVAEVETNLALHLQECSRNFLYSGKARRRTYSVTFLVKEWSDTLPLLIHILHAKSVGMGDIYAATKKTGFFERRKKKLKGKKRKYMFKLLQKMYNHYRSRYKNNKNTVLFLYESDYNMASNLKAVQKRMLKRGLDKDFTILEYAWVADMPSQYNIFQRFRNQRLLMKNLAMANIVFVDNYVPAFTRVKLDAATTIVTLWHAGIGFKAVGYSRWGHLAASAPFLGHRVYTYGICGSRQVAHCFSEAWGINSERVLPTGMPRMDKYLDESHREAKVKELYEKFPACKNKKVILFAPTFRGNNHPDAYYPYDIMDFDRLYDLCGDEYVVLFKMHPWVSEPVPITPEYADKFFDLTSYPDINNLFYITDLLITDYSSCIYEYSLMHKPMLFFAFDEMQYSISRGFHHDYRKAAPGKVCNTFDELLTAIEAKDFEIEKVEQYVKRNFDVIDSGASDRVIDWFLLGKMPRYLVDDIKARDAEMDYINQLDFNSLNPDTVTEEPDPDEQEGESDDNAKPDGD